ncbi:MAG: SMP-30/gluconolactonase/LRE family protein [Chloroflexota bacterium]
MFEVRDPRFWDVVDVEFDLTKVASGFIFTEGPIWHEGRQELTFSDIPGNTQYRWTEAGGVTTFRTPSHMSNGNTYDRQGNMLSCEHGTSRVSRITLDEDGNEQDYTVLATHYNGKELNSPNDIVVNQAGMIYFTDPPYGRSARHGVERTRELDFCGVYRLNPADGSLTLLVDDFDRPNGLCFSMDETQLLINDTERRHIRVFDVEEDGTLVNDEIFAETVGEGHSKPDGMKIDSDENIYCCGPGGFHIFSSGGSCLGVIQVPEHTTNFCFGDADMQSLYITASTSIYRIRTRVPGHRIY